MVLPPAAAPPSLVKRSGSELEIASDTFCAPPGAAAAVPSAARIAGTAAATSFCATASLTPTARARVLTICGVRNCCTRLTRLMAIATPLDPARNDRRPSNRLSSASRASPHRKISCGGGSLDDCRAKSYPAPAKEITALPARLATRTTLEKIRTSSPRWLTPRNRVADQTPFRLGGLALRYCLHRIGDDVALDAPGVP